MGRNTKSNVSQAALRWSVERAGVEFGLTSNTLRKAVNRDSAAPDKDGLFTTQQIAAAIYGCSAPHCFAELASKCFVGKLVLSHAVSWVWESFGQIRAGSCGTSD